MKLKTTEIRQKIHDALFDAVIPTSISEFYGIRIESTKTKHVGDGLEVTGDYGVIEYDDGNGFRPKSEDFYTYKVSIAPDGEATVVDAGMSE